MSRPKPGAESTMRRGFPDAVQKKILIIYGAIFGVGVLYAFLILHTPFRIPCLFREVTGLQCPGCGTSRMALALMRFDITAAFAYNPVAFFSFPAWFLISIAGFFGHPKILPRSKDPSADPLHQYRDLYDFCDFSKSATFWLNPLHLVKFYIFYPGFSVFSIEYD